MTSGTLSQSELNRLLTHAAQAPRTAPAARGEVQAYDFRRTHRVSKERLRTLEAMYEQIVRSLEGWLVGRTRGHVELQLISVEQYTFGDFTLSLPTPCASYLFDINGSSEQQGIIDFGRDFSSFLVDRLFGGNGMRTVVPDRALTPIERMAIKVVVERLLTLLSEAWQDYIPLHLALSGFESMPEILRGGTRDDSVLVGKIQVRAGEHESQLQICLPFGVLEKFFSSARERRLSSSASSEREREMNRELTENSLRSTSVPVAARLPEFGLPLAQLAALRVGSVLSTGIPVDAELEIRVSNQVRYRATPGRIGRRLAVRINRDLAEPLNHPGPLSTETEK